MVRLVLTPKGGPARGYAPRVGHCSQRDWGPSEILKHETTKLLFAPRNLDTLATALLRLIGDADLRQRPGKAAAFAVRQRWLWPKLIADMQSVCAELKHAA